MLLGSLGPIPRARVTDLVQVDPDVPMAPNHRANTLVGSTMLTLWFFNVDFKCQSTCLFVLQLHNLVPLICQPQQGSTAWGSRVWIYFEAMPPWGNSAGGGECECLWFDSQPLRRVVPSNLGHAVESFTRTRSKSWSFHIHWLLHRWCWTK